MKIMSVFKSFFIDKKFKEDITFLKKVSLFEGLNDVALGELLTISSRKTYVPGEVVFEAGTPGKVLYIIKSGEVEGIKNGKVIFTLKEGDYFGEIALLDETPRTATVRAKKQSELLLIYKVKFDGFILDDPLAGVKVLRSMASKIITRLGELEEHGK